MPSIPIVELFVFIVVVAIAFCAFKAVLLQSPPKKSAAERAQTEEFSRKALFNKSELKIFNVLREELNVLAPTYTLMGQVSLAEIIKTDSPFKKGGGYYAVSNRRLD